MSKVRVDERGLPIVVEPDFAKTQTFRPDISLADDLRVVWRFVKKSHNVALSVTELVRFLARQVRADVESIDDAPPPSGAPDGDATPPAKRGKRKGG